MDETDLNISPLISVIIPCFNQGSFLEDSINSVRDQNLNSNQFEILIINDGSTDQNTLQVIEEIRKLNASEITIFDQSNRGLANARNFGVSQATGKFIQFLDADDLLLPGKWAKQLKHLEHNPETDVIISDFEFSDENLKERWMLPGLRPELKNDLVQDFLFRWERGLCIPIHTALFNKAKCWGDQPVFISDLKAKEDWYMWTKLALSRKKIFYLPEVLVIYRLHARNMCKELSFSMQEIIRAIYRIRDLINDVELRQRFESESLNHVTTNYLEAYGNISAQAALEKKLKSLRYRIVDVIYFTLLKFKLLKKLMGKLGNFINRKPEVSNEKKN